MEPSSVVPLRPQPPTNTCLTAYCGPALDGDRARGVSMYQCLPNSQQVSTPLVTLVPEHASDGPDTRPDAASNMS